MNNLEQPKTNIDNKNKIEENKVIYSEQVDLWDEESVINENIDLNSNKIVANIEIQTHLWEKTFILNLPNKTIILNINNSDKDFIVSKSKFNSILGEDYSYLSKNISFKLSNTRIMEWIESDIPVFESDFELIK